MRIGVVLTLEGSAHHGVPRYREVRAAARHAEAMGLDAVWLYDHLLFRPPDGPPFGQWDCLAFLPALAEATERVTLGTVVACTAFRNPAVLAKTASALDEVSGGRFTLGVGAGWNEAELRAVGVPLDHRVGRFEEALAVIATLLRDGRADVAGRFHRAVDLLDEPRGPTPGGPPLLVGAWGPRMLRLAARHADLVDTFVDPADPGPRLGAVRDACADVGRDPATLAVTCNLRARYPDLGRTPHMGDEATATDDLAAQLAALEAAGVAQVMVDVQPLGVAALDRLGEAVAACRALSSAR